MAIKATTQRTKGMQECIQNCFDCYRICVETINYCLQQGGKHAEATHIGLLTNCADICLTCANFMLHGSAQYKDACAVCAKVCDSCADSCEKLGDAQMKACADMCRRCAESCRQMAA